MHPSVYEATADELISRGWGSHPRHLIPDDWMNRRGPDAIWGKQRAYTAYRRPRRTYAELRAIRLGEPWPPVQANAD